MSAIVVKKNKPENPFQNYDVGKKTLKTNHDFSHSLRKKKHFKEKTGKFWAKPETGHNLSGKLMTLKIRGIIAIISY